jgi:hypothetical protein
MGGPDRTMNTLAETAAEAETSRAHSVVRDDVQALRHLIAARQAGDSRESAGMLTCGPGTDALGSVLDKHFPGNRAHLVLMASSDTDGFEGVQALLAPNGQFWFYMTFGISDLGEKRGTHPALSGLGYELTLRAPGSPEASPPEWPIALLNNLARFLRPMKYDVLDSEPIQFNEPLSTASPTALTAIMFADDVQLGYGVDSANGFVQFRQVVGITEDEAMYQSAFGRARLQEKLAASNPFLLTILDRSSVLPPPL